MSDPIALPALLGRNLRRLRLEGMATHDDLVRAARVCGLDLPARWFASLERGARQVSGAELIWLPIVLAEALRHAVGLADLLLGEEPVRLTAESAPVLPATIRELITAHPQRRFFAAGPGQGQVAPDGSPLARAAERMREIREAGLGGVDVRALSRSEEGAGEREDRLARRLGVAPVVVVAACAALFGRSLTEECAARLSEPDAPPSAAVMRRLTAKVTEEIARAAKAMQPDQAATPTSSATTPRVSVVEPPRPMKATAGIPAQRAAAAAGASPGLGANAHPDALGTAAVPEASVS